MGQENNRDSGVVFLHEHRELADHPEQTLTNLMWRLIEHKDPLELAEAYALKKAEEVYLQGVCKGRFDRDEYYDAMIAWALGELGELSAAAKQVSTLG